MIALKQEVVKSKNVGRISYLMKKNKIDVHQALGSL